jgi:hypothetical protein
LFAPHHRSALEHGHAAVEHEHWLAAEVRKGQPAASRGVKEAVRQRWVCKHVDVDVVPGLMPKKRSLHMRWKRPRSWAKGMALPVRSSVSAPNCTSHMDVSAKGVTTRVHK